MTGMAAVKRKLGRPVDHPTLEAQQAALDQTLACVTEASVTRLCDQVRLLSSSDIVAQCALDR